MKNLLYFYTRSRESSAYLKRELDGKFQDGSNLGWQAPLFSLEWSKFIISVEHSHSHDVAGHFQEVED